MKLSTEEKIGSALFIVGYIILGFTAGPGVVTGISFLIIAHTLLQHD